jgi:hypothetical protein
MKIYFFVRGLMTLIFFFFGRAADAAAAAGIGDRSRAPRPPPPPTSNVPVIITSVRYSRLWHCSH